jgi:hypothetical protein
MHDDLWIRPPGGCLIAVTCPLRTRALLGGQLTQRRLGNCVIPSACVCRADEHCSRESWVPPRRLTSFLPWMRLGSTVRSRLADLAES